MKKALFALGLLLVFGLLVAGCSKQTVEETPTGDTDTTTGTEETPVDYIEDELIDENSTVEIGEMI